MYGPIENGGFLIPPVPYQQIDPRHYCHQVIDLTGEALGTIVVDTSSCFLYIVQPGGTAMRHGVGIGREGLLGGAMASSSNVRSGRAGSRRMALMHGSPNDDGIVGCDRLNLVPPLCPSNTMPPAAIVSAR